MKNSEQPINPVTPTHFTDRCGLTKREYFAGLAMQALISNAPNGHLSNSKEGVELALDWTDELLKQLEK